MGYTCVYCELCGDIDINGDNFILFHITRKGEEVLEGLLCIDCYNNENEFFEYTLNEDEELMIEINEQDINIYDLVRK